MSQSSLSKPAVSIVHISRHGLFVKSKSKHRHKRRRRIAPTSFTSNDHLSFTRSNSNFETNSTTHTDSILIKEQKDCLQDEHTAVSKDPFWNDISSKSVLSSRFGEIDTDHLRQTWFKRRRKRRQCGFFWICSWPCCILCYTFFMLLTAVGLAVLVINLTQKTTVTTTIKTTETTTTTTTTSTATSTSTSSTSSSSISTSTSTSSATTSTSTSSSSATTSTSTSSSSATTSTSTSSSSTTSTSTTSTTTTTRRDCGSSCANQTWISSSNLLAKWLFDGSFDDQTTIFNATGVNNPSFVDSYVDLGVSLDPNLNQSVFASHLPLSNTSFTITAWLNVTSYLSQTFHSILGICSATVSRQCLNIAIRRDSSNYFLYMDFFGSNCQGTINLLVNTWYHVGFVFDLTTMTQSIYLDGLLDQSCIVSSSPLMLTPTTVTTIGCIPLLIPLNGSNFYHGLIDQLIVYQRVRSSCELFEEAALVLRFEFDGALADKDLGPNNLPGSGSQYTYVPSIRSPQGINFAGNNESHFRIEHISVLGIPNHPFSIVYWIQSTNLSGSIIHLSSWSDGRGWCMPYMGFNINGSIFAEVLSGGVRAIADPNQLPIQTWSHVAQTWSPTNGLRLYINATLVASNSTLGFNGASGVPMYIFLGSGVTGLFHCAKGALPWKIPFPGAIDDFRIYNRELTAVDICTIQVAP